MKNISNKALVGIFGTLAVLGTAMVTGSAGALWGLVLVCFVIGEVED